jgi:diaminopimelate epimerase
MRIDYTLLDPTGNLTILVGTPVAAADQPRLAAALMAAEPGAEQVGFLTRPAPDADVALRMAGGEFCGNAAMSAAALFCAQNAQKRAMLRVTVSGETVAVSAEETARDAFVCAVEMPRPQRISEAFGFPLVAFSGISHLIVTAPMSRAAAEAAAPDWCAALGAEALGMMLLSPDGARLDPLVWVPAADTLVWERSCASGTAAAGAYLAAARGAPVALDFAEPGGVLGVSATPEGAVSLRGSVRIRKRAAFDG